jgi:acylphosphatase
MPEVVRRFLVTGKVQGVYFRHSTRLEATRLKVRGLVRNLSDGSVEVVAQGGASEVEELRQWLHRGPAHARVDAVSELDVAASSRLENPADFSVF